MTSSRKIIFHGKVHDVSEREEDSSKVAREIAARNKRSKVKLFFEGYCAGQTIRQREERNLYLNQLQ